MMIAKYTMLLGSTLCVALVASRAAADDLTPILDAISWGEPTPQLAQHFGSRALHVAPPIDFGDSYVDLALRDQTIGGYGFTVFFQMDRTTHGLKRVMLQRQRHGANPMVLRAVLDALQRDYGTPQEDCSVPASAHNGYQASGISAWVTHGVAVRAVARSTTLEAEGGCNADIACGLTGQLYVQITPLDKEAPPCR